MIAEIKREDEGAADTIDQYREASKRKVTEAK